MSKTDESRKADIIALKAAERYGMDLTDIFSVTRKREVREKRQVIQHLCKELTKMSLSGIGAHFSDYGPAKDHTTVLHAHKKIEDLIFTDKKLRADVEWIKSRSLAQFREIEREKLRKSPGEMDLHWLRAKIFRAVRVSKTEEILKNELIAIL